MRKLKGESWHIGYPADGPSEWSGFGCTCSIPKHFAAPSLQPPSSLSPDTVHVWASPHTKRVFNLWLSRGPQGRSPVATLHPSTQCRRMSLRAYVCLDLSTCICDRAAHVFLRILRTAEACAGSQTADSPSQVPIALPISLRSSLARRPGASLSVRFLRPPGRSSRSSVFTFIPPCCPPQSCALPSNFHDTSHPCSLLFPLIPL